MDPSSRALALNMKGLETLLGAMTGTTASRVGLAGMLQQFGLATPEKPEDNAGHAYIYPPPRKSFPDGVATRLCESSSTNEGESSTSYTDDVEDDASEDTADGDDERRWDISEEQHEEANERLKKVLERNHYERFENKATRFTCSECRSDIVEFEFHYTCDECDAWVCCEQCFIAGGGTDGLYGVAVQKHHRVAAAQQREKWEDKISIVQGHASLPPRDDESSTAGASSSSCFCTCAYCMLRKFACLPHYGRFYLPNAVPRWTFKTRLFECNSTAELVHICMTRYSERFFLGESLMMRLDEEAQATRSVASNTPEVIGPFRWFSYDFVHHLSRRVAIALHDVLDICAPSQIAICAENRLEWAAVELACITQGYVSVAVHHTSSTDDTALMFRDAMPQCVFTSSRFLCKVIEAAAQFPSVRCIVCMDELTPDHRAFHASHIHGATPFLLSFSALINDVDLFGVPDVPVVREDSDPATIMFTSGSTGYPKAVVFHEGKWIDQIVAPLTLRNVVLYGYLPLDHIAGRTDLFMALFNGGRIAFNPIVSSPAAKSRATANEDEEDEDGLKREKDDEATEASSSLCDEARRASRMDILFLDILALRPTGLGPVPLLCNAIYARYRGIVASCSPGERESIRTRLSFTLGDRISSIKVTSAPVASKVRAFLRETLNVLVNEGYGSTEVGSIAKNHIVTQVVRLESIPELGYVVTNTPNPQGEIQVRRTRMSGFKDASLQEEKFTADGWLRTGDVGERVGEHGLRVIDRISNVVKMSNGEFVALERVERVLSDSKYICQSLMYADAHKNAVVGVVVPAPAFVGLEGKDRDRYESDMLQSIASLAAKENLRSHECPRDIFIDWSGMEWTSGNGLLTNSNKPRRRALFDHYRAEINGMYVALAAQKVLHRDGDTESLRHCGHQQSFAALGGDSLSAMRLVEELKEQNISCRVEDVLSGRSLLRSAVQHHATTTERVVHSDDDLVDVDDDVAAMKELCSSQLCNCRSDVPSSTRKRVFVTGASGFVGRHIVEEILLRMPEATVVCLVRRSGSAPDVARVEEVVGDVSLRRFGLSKEEFHTLCAGVDEVVHAAAMVNHLVSFEHLYRTNVRSMLEIVRLARSCKKKRVHYISSISAARSMHTHGMGYGSSKWAAERLLRTAIDVGSVPAIVYRLSLVTAHTRTGALNPKDWLSRLLAAIVRFKAVPQPSEVGADPLCLVPVDYCAAIVTSMIGREEAGRAEGGLLLHVARDNVSYRDLYAMMAKSDPSIRVLPYRDWYEHVRVNVIKERHMLFPFLDRFREPMNGGRSRYSTASLDEALGSSVPFTMINEEHVGHMIRFLEALPG